MWDNEEQILTSEIAQRTQNELDSFCKNQNVLEKVGCEITLNNDICYYQTNPALTFGNGNMQTGLDKYGFYGNYKAFCMDIDGINKGEDPFGFGIRVDGKILPGARADEWINKSIQKEE